MADVAWCIGGSRVIAFVSGGARSGKSEVAERLVRQWGERASQERFQATYIATALRSDMEMDQRIQYHLARRGAAWTTYELPAASKLSDVLKEVTLNHPVLLDCVTIWLSRMLFEERGEPGAIQACWKECLQICMDRQLAIVIVSNDLNEGMPISDEWTHLYMRLLQTLHQLTLDEATLAVQAVAGLPLVWKGEL